MTDLKPDCEDRIIVALHNMAAEKSDWRSGFSAFEALLSELDRRTFIPLRRISHDYDQQLSQIYKENIKLIAIITKSFGVKPIFVPELSNYRMTRAIGRLHLP